MVCEQEQKTHCWKLLTYIYGIYLNLKLTHFIEVVATS